ncbi:MAG: SpoIIE family protein phosphatase [Pirellulaceae bacterium]|nr:SpoIIE family protein phosphatase [Pirellulaceae bacterium]
MNDNFPHNDLPHPLPSQQNLPRVQNDSLLALEDYTALVVSRIYSLLEKVTGYTITDGSLGRIQKTKGEAQPTPEEIAQIGLEVFHLAEYASDVILDTQEVLFSCSQGGESDKLNGQDHEALDELNHQILGDDYKTTQDTDDQLADQPATLSKETNSHQKSNKIGETYTLTQKHFEQFNQILLEAVDMTGSSAAAIYLLDDATTELTLFSNVGLPVQSTLFPSRPLKEALADLEAMLGHAVVLDQIHQLPKWNCPEKDFYSACCLPILSKDNILGTIWFFDDVLHDYTPDETNLAEIYAARIADELDKIEAEQIPSIHPSKPDSTHLHEPSSLSIVSAPNKEPSQANHPNDLFQVTADLAQQSEEAKEISQKGFRPLGPTVTPFLQNNQLSIHSWKRQARPFSGEFSNTAKLPNEKLAGYLCSTQGYDLQAGILATEFNAAITAHLQYPHSSQGLLGNLNNTIYNLHRGDHFGHFGYFQLDPTTGKIEFSTAGQIIALLLKNHCCQIWNHDAPPIGLRAGHPFEVESLQVEPGQSFLLLSGGIFQELGTEGKQLQPRQLAQHLLEQTPENAEELLVAASCFLQQFHPQKLQYDQTILTMRRE